MLQKLSRLIFAGVLLGGQVFAMPNFVDIAEEVWRRQVGISFVDEQAVMLKLAHETHKYAFVACLGQSWCPWSKKFSEEVLQKKEFLEGIEQFAVLGFVDVPESYEENVGEKTEEIVRKYELKELPTFFLLDPEGEVVAKFGYLPLSAKELVIHIGKMISDYEEIKQFLTNPIGEISGKELENLYLKAKAIGCEKKVGEIFQLGLAKEEGVFFLVEKYSKLLENEKKLTSDTKTLKRKILAKDPHNIQGSILQLAQIEFEMLRHNLKKRNDTKKVIAPLLEYVRGIGKNDKVNLWHVELMIAQYLFGKDAKQEALLHALASYEAAPQEKKNEIIDVVSYIRSDLPEDFTLGFAKK